MEQELRHHGIDGQKWGKRNGPPYPLDPADYSQAEKAANKISSLVSKGSSHHHESARKRKKKIDRLEKLTAKDKTFGIKDDNLTDDEQIGKANVLNALKSHGVAVTNPMGLVSKGRGDGHQKAGRSSITEK